MTILRCVKGFAAMIELQVTLFSPEKGFTPNSFHDLIGRSVQVTGVDPSYENILQKVEISPDFGEAHLTVSSYSEAYPDLKAVLSFRTETPKAQVRAFAHETDEHLVTSFLDAPLREGQLVDVNGKRHIVKSLTHPFREPENPEQKEDYQRVTLAESEETPVVFDLGPMTPFIALMQ